MSPVALILLDGLRPEALAAANCFNLNLARKIGASTMNAQSVMPSITLPVHASIFHSVPPGRHGITSNDWTPMARPLPGLVDVAKDHGLRSYFFHNWEPLRNLNRPGALHFSYYRDNCHSPDGDDLIAAQAASAISQERPDFAFVYLGTIDVAGHDHGWMSAKYLEQVERVDTAVGLLLGSLPADWQVVITSDHGGHDRSHGMDIPEDMTVPWIAAGPAIRQGHAIDRPVSLLDTAPTIARLLGVNPHREWEGACVEEILA